MSVAISSNQLSVIFPDSHSCRIFPVRSQLLHSYRLPQLSHSQYSSWLLLCSSYSNFCTALSRIFPIWCRLFQSWHRHQLWSSEFSFCCQFLCYSFFNVHRTFPLFSNFCIISYRLTFLLKCSVFPEFTANSKFFFPSNLSPPLFSLHLPFQAAFFSRCLSSWSSWHWARHVGAILSMKLGTIRLADRKIILIICIRIHEKLYSLQF